MGQEDRSSSLASSNHGDTVALLIDADGVNIDTVKATMTALQGYGKVVSITSFGWPRAAKTKKWKEFIEQQGIRFKAVSRNYYGNGDPNDIEIAYHARRMASTKVQRIALLMHNADVIPLITEMQKLGKE